MVALERALHLCTREQAPKKCPKDFGKRRLFFEPPNSFSNARGERFSTYGRPYYGKMFYELFIERNRALRGKLLFEVRIQIRRADERIKIISLNTSSEIAPRANQAKPAREDCGYGILPIAVGLSRFFAQENDLSRITIIPGGGTPSEYKALREYYSSFGFEYDVPNRDHLDFRELVLELAKP